MKKMVDKRAQTQWEITGWILALLILVAVGIIVYYFMQSTGDITDNMIKKAEVIAQTCSGLASPEFVNSYCLQLREIDKKRYVTCYSLTDKSNRDYEEFGIYIPDSDVMNSECANPEVSAALKKVAILKCKELKKETSTDVFIAGKTCNKWGGARP